MPGLVEIVSQKREEIWVNEPQEVKASFLNAKGSGDSTFFPCLYGDFEARACHHALYTLRQTLRSGDVDFEAAKEVAGFITAVTYVRPSKSIEEVQVKSVLKKMKDKAFARAVSRDDIKNGAAGIGIPLEDHIQFCIDAMKNKKEILGL